VYDGTATNVDAGFNDGSVTAMSANWSGFTFNTSGLAYYEYSIGTSPGGTTVKAWTSTAQTASVTATGLTLHTGQTYYVNVRATDLAGNSTVVSSNGQIVAPVLSFNLSSTSIVFDALGSTNSYTSSKTLTAGITTNAYNGYQVTQRATALMTGGSGTIPMYAGTWTTPTSWTGTGFGYTSSDTSVSGSNRFNNAGNYAGISTGSSDVVADSSSPAVTGDSYIITYRVTTPASQAASNYSTALILSAVVSV
jgi:hypothetical protein